MKRILIINPFGIGDVLFTTPVIATLREVFPDAFIGYWCNRRVRGILKADPNINVVFALSRGDLKHVFRENLFKGIGLLLSLLSDIKKERFDISLDYSQDHRYGLFSKLAGIKRRIGFDYKGRGRFLTDKIPLEGFSDKHVVEYYLDLLDSLVKIRERKNGLYLKFGNEGKSKALNILSSYGIGEKDLVIGMVPGGGASWGQGAWLKHWPAEGFAQLADRIIENFKAKIVILGDEFERAIAQRVVNSMNQKTIDLTGRLDLPELISVIDNLKLLITNDGGPLHIAVALGKKTVSFFGPVNPLVYGPYPDDSNRHIVLNKKIDCSPCYVGFRLRPCIRHKECLESINADEAFNAAAKLLNN